MLWRRLVLGLVLAVAIVALVTQSAKAQLFGKRPAPPPPAQRVPELLKILKEDGDENKRFDAVEELRGMDVKMFPEIIPALVEAMLNDKKPSVRAESAYTIGRVRPVTPLVGSALEAARDHDTSMRVRLQARTTLVGYYLAGYRSIKMEEPKQTLPVPQNGSTTKEPPLAPVPGKEPPLAPGTTITRPGSNLPSAPPPVVVERPGKVEYQPLPKGTVPLPLPPAGGPDLGQPPK